MNEASVNAANDTTHAGLAVEMVPERSRAVRDGPVDSSRLTIICTGDWTAATEPFSK